MKILLVLLSLLLVGCLATSAVTVQRYVERDHIDKRLAELKEAEKVIEHKRQELEQYADKLVKERVIAVEPTGSGGSPAASPPRVAAIESPKPVMAPAPPISVRNPPLAKPKNNSIDTSTVVGQLYTASAVFAVPNTANITEDIKAQLLIDPSKTVEELSKNATVGPVQSAQQIKISKIVIAKLEAPDFEVTKLTSEEQAVAETEKTEWLWTLRPKSAGLHPINLTVMAEVTIGNKSTKYHLRTFDKQVMIEVSIFQMMYIWWNKYWQWIITTIIIPLIAWVYKVKTNKPKN